MIPTRRHCRYRYYGRYYHNLYRRHYRYICYYCHCHNCYDHRYICYWRVLGVWLLPGNQIVIFLTMKIDESPKHYLTQTLLTINWRYWPVEKKFTYAYEGSRLPRVQFRWFLYLLCYSPFHSYLIHGPRSWGSTTTRYNP